MFTLQRESQEVKCLHEVVLTYGLQIPSYPNLRHHQNLVEFSQLQVDEPFRTHRYLDWLRIRST